MKYRLRRLYCRLTSHRYELYPDEDAEWWICAKCDDYYREKA